MRSRRLVPGLVAAALVAGALLASVSSASGGTTLRQVISGGRTDPWWTPTFSAFYTKSVTTEMFSSPVVGDVDGDGVPDIVAGYPDGTVVVWRGANPASRVVFSIGAGAVQASPALADVNGDGVADIVVGNTAGDMTVTSLRGGTPKRIFTTHGDCQHFPVCGFFSSPAVADLDGDGRPEIIASSWDQHLYAWHADGSLVRGFPIFLKDTIWSSPAVADLDRDGHPDIVVGGDCDGVDGQPCHPQRGGYVWAFHGDGSSMPGWPRFIPGQVVWSSPAIVDLTGDGELDVVVGTGTNMPAPAGSVVYAFDRQGHDLPGWPVTTGGRVMGSPAIGDINGDGRLDVVVPAEDGRIYAFSRDGRALPGWPQCNVNDRAKCPTTVHGSAVIADVDGDGRLEVVQGGEQWLRVYDGAGGVKAEVPTRSGTAPLTSSPTIASIRGTTWIIQNSGFDASGDGFPDVGALWVWDTGTPLGAAPWPMFRQNPQRTGAGLNDLSRGGAPVSSPPTTRTTGRSSTPRASTPATTPTVAPTTSTSADSTTTSLDTTTTTELHEFASPRQPAHRGGPSSNAPWLFIGVGTLGLGVSAALWWLRRRGRRVPA